MQNSILIIDDDYAGLVCSKKMLNKLNPDLKIYTATNLAEGIKILGGQKISVIILDLCLEPVTGVESGFRALKTLLDLDSSLRIIVLTGHDLDEYGIRALVEGAANFLSKPVCYEHLFALVKDGIQQAELKRAYKKLLQNQKFEYAKHLVGNSNFHQDLLNSLDFACRTDQPVLITGETGTGKGYLANLIHKFSKRKNSKFVRLQPVFTNLDLVNSELFGHERGAFTGAGNERIGLFREANSGTLFLDEIDSFSPAIQVALLGVLQDKKFRPLGSNTEIESDFRLISATNQDIEKALEEKRIRQDLYFRIAHFRIHLLSLRERKEDLLEIAKFLLAKKSVSLQFSKEAENLILNYDWPGNIRELESSIESAFMQSEYRGRKIIEPDDLSFLIKDSPDILVCKDFNSQVAVFKTDLVKKTLRQNGNNYSKTSKKLGIDRGTVKRIMES